MRRETQRQPVKSSASLSIPTLEEALGAGGFDAGPRLCYHLHILGDAPKFLLFHYEVRFGPPRAYAKRMR
jgi:hypothetical protein